MYEGLAEQYILPALGGKRVAEVSWEDVARLHAQVAVRRPIPKSQRHRGGPFQANRLLATLSKAFALAARWGMLPRDRPNPASGHDKQDEQPGRRGQALDAAPLGRLGKAIAAEPASPMRDALLVALLSGARPGEVCALRWADLENEGRVVRLREAKTGPRALYLGAPAAELVARRPRVGEYVFAGLDGTRIYDLQPLWQRVKAAAGLDASVRLYDAGRHSFASRAEELGVDSERRRILTGHAPAADAHARYVHRRPATLLAAADRVAEAIAAELRGEEPPAADVLAFRMGEQSWTS
jgi:integrase